ncbi:sirohydrochlorin chelatase [Echinimonas agarilytica]|uniref:CbiX/SirB N-terminal domain-containing protein n=1 Tax=Echinimonas agarilytica TaxID=1215918 RepID=A0AA41W548_9GAMM|nr:CbiX/SirB N-terminal domain-containing protein [Echinimonas agarilytica]MCM2678854.1 CbiX/SirB N-terminal domain-containing protein [Echinimonas agarilytica]
MTPIKGLVLAAHGSRLKASNEEVTEFTQVLASSLIDQYKHIVPAFLELAKPSIEDSIDAAVAAGCTDITVVPYFLAAGRHVREDVPEIIEERQKAHPHVTIQATPHLGVSEALKQAVIHLL